MKRLLTVALAVLLLGTYSAPVGAAGRLDQLHVETINLYIGTDVGDVLLALPPDVPTAVLAAFENIIATNFPERAQTLAQKILESPPDLIGLQEVEFLATFDTLGDLFSNNPSFVLDFLPILLAALGGEYEVAAGGAAVVVNTNISPTNPDLTHPPFLPMDETAGSCDPDPLLGFPGCDFAVLVDSDVILARITGKGKGKKASGVITTSNAFPFSYTFFFGRPVVSVAVKRGFVAVDATVRGQDYRFVNTHLEPFVPLLNAAQTTELIAVIDVLNGLDPRRTILVGDINSDPRSATDPVNFPNPSYVQLTSAGYVDTWLLRAGRTLLGFTCCQDSDLLNAQSALDERIDVIFVRSEAPRRVNALVLGDDVDEDKTPSGLWTSDHAGVVSKMGFSD